MVTSAAVVVLGLLVLPGLWIAFPVSGRHARAESVAIAGDLVAPEAELALYHRYLVRVRRHRRYGGVLGVLVAFVVAVRIQSPVGFSYGNGAPVVDLLLLGLAGVVLGALAAESYRLAASREPLRAASLAPRAALPGRRAVLAARVLTVAALAGSGLVAVVARDSGPLLATLSGAAIVMLAELTRRAVLHRRRPVLPERAAHVDGRLREASARSMAFLEAAAGLMTFLWALPDVPAGMPEWLRAIERGATLAATVVLVVLLVRAGPRASRDVRRAVAEGFQGRVVA